MTEISLAEFNAMPRITPTGYAEQRHAMTQKDRAKELKASGEVPAAKAAYRATLDNLLLGRLAREAYAAEEARELPAHEREEVVAALVADLAERFPASEMEILRKYGHGSAYPTLIVEMPTRPPVRFDLDDPRWLPPQRCNFTSCGPEVPMTMRVPAVTDAYFEKLALLRSQAREVNLLVQWPSQFKARHQRAPRWAEIEEHWPILGRYLADRRVESMA